MHFDQREQAALRAAGLSTDELQEASRAVAATAEREAARLEAFFDRETVYSDVDTAHSDAAVQEHDLRFVDLFTHAEAIRGYVRFDTWGAWVADGRVLGPTSAVPSAEGPEEVDHGDADGQDAGAEAAVVELSLGPTIHDRVRFAADPEEL
jgi:hypothetical protein